MKLTSFCARSDALFHAFRCIVLSENKLFNGTSLFSLVRVVCFLSLPYRTSSPLNPLRQSLHSSRSTAEHDRCLSGNYCKFLNTVTHIFGLKTSTTIVSSLVKTIFTFHVTKKRKHYVISGAR